MRERDLALSLALLAAFLLVVGAIVDFAFAAPDLFRGRLPGSLGFLAIELVVAALTAVFGLYGASRSGENALAAGVLLVVLALLDWGLLGFARGLFSLLGLVLTLLSGVLFALAGGRRR